jgi:phosphoserine/homoserine phosphotransferase
MLLAADAGIFFRPPEKIVAEFPQFPVTQTYEELRLAFVRGGVAEESPVAPG